MKMQFFARPDRYIARTGDLNHRIVRVNIPDAPGFMRGMRAVFVSDTHVISRTTGDDLKKLADSIKTLAPDILLLGGDYADRHADAVRFFDALKHVTPPYGIYACVGNNDTEDMDDSAALPGIMKAFGIELLINESRTVPVNGGKLVIAGVDEPFEGNPDYAGLYPEKPAEGIYRLLLSHFPSVPGILPDLMLSGHTHGGQFNAFGITPYTIGFERIFKNSGVSMAISGLHHIDGAWLFVGKGIGASRIQMRIGVQPEIYELQFEC